jgi:hypothetical protein
MKWNPPLLDKCSNWKKQCIKQELYNVLPLNPVDIKWLIDKEAQFLRALEAAAAKKTPSAAAVADNNGDKTPSWHMYMPYLRLYYCLTLDEVKVHMSSQFQVMDKEELSARNLDMQPPTYWQLLADKFNDKTLSFTTEILPELHEMFSEPIELSFDKMPGPTNAEQMKKKVAACWAMLVAIHVLFPLFVLAIDKVLTSFFSVLIKAYSFVEMQWKWSWSATQNRERIQSWSTKMRTKRAYMRGHLRKCMV